MLDILCLKYMYPVVFSKKRSLFFFKRNGKGKSFTFSFVCRERNERSNRKEERTSYITFMPKLGKNGKKEIVISGPVSNQSDHFL